MIEKEVRGSHVPIEVWARDPLPVSSPTSPQSKRLTVSANAVTADCREGLRQISGVRLLRRIYGKT